ncbi:hypothetical protein EPUS_08714 [Endocarpon pusillum Z07020]|uniref:Uncharacterized protein n=1 Tax=Endocarpon pusillum (strain Z07020 / HMAS-L-300199) TaxID=1263415 RepID=U1GMD6_ENDPU|nr:uncharacterized protein EPUS_08714 [Endocarpon pusillum Z07020]ERF73066.1 hypothetical protein EPUS_08714 [Endocarpon pusillum Z07020]
MSLAAGSTTAQNEGAQTSPKIPMGRPAVSGGQRKRQFWFSFYAHLVLFPRNAAYWDDSSREQFLRGLGTTFPMRTSFKHPRAKQTGVPGREQSEGKREWKVHEIHSLPKPISMPDPSYQHRIPGWHTKLLSPDILFNERSEWKNEIQQSWQAYIQSQCTLTMPMEMVDQRSGVKVFVEPDYTVADLKRIARAVIYFEDPLNQYFFTFPYDGNRRDRTNNRADNPAFKGKDLRQILMLIEYFDKATVNPTTYWNRIFPVPPASKGYWWSYTKTRQQGGCIEMAKPAAWYGWEHAVKWVESTVYFVQAALACPSSQRLRQYEISEKGLGEFVQTANGRDLETIHRDTMDACHKRDIRRDGPLNEARNPAAAK